MGILSIALKRVLPHFIQAGFSKLHNLKIVEGLMKTVGTLLCFKKGQIRYQFKAVFAISKLELNAFQKVSLILSKTLVFTALLYRG